MLQFGQKYAIGMKYANGIKYTNGIYQPYKFYYII